MTVSEHFPERRTPSGTVAERVLVVFGRVINWFYSSPNPQVKAYFRSTPPGRITASVSELTRDELTELLRPGDAKPPTPPAPVDEDVHASIR